MQRVLCPNPRCQRELQVSMLNEFSECPICHYTFSVSGSRGNFGQSQGVRAGRVESSLDALFSPSASAGVQVGGSVDGLLGSGMLEPSLDHNFFLESSTLDLTGQHRQPEDQDHAPRSHHYERQQREAQQRRTDRQRLRTFAPQHPTLEAQALLHRQLEQQHQNQQQQQPQQQQRQQHLRENQRLQQQEQSTLQGVQHHQLHYRHRQDQQRMTHAHGRQLDPYARIGLQTLDELLPQIGGDSPEGGFQIPTELRPPLTTRTVHDFGDLTRKVDSNNRAPIKKAPAKGRARGKIGSKSAEISGVLGQVGAGRSRGGGRGRGRARGKRGSKSKAGASFSASTQSKTKNAPASDTASARSASHSKRGNKTTMTRKKKPRKSKTATPPAASSASAKGASSSQSDMLFQLGQQRVKLRNIKTGAIVAGFTAPMRKNLDQYLKKHPYLEELKEGSEREGKKCAPQSDALAATQKATPAPAQRPTSKADRQGPTASTLSLAGSPAPAGGRLNEQFPKLPSHSSSLPDRKPQGKAQKRKKRKSAELQKASVSSSGSAFNKSPTPPLSKSVSEKKTSAKRKQPESHTRTKAFERSTKAPSKKASPWTVPASTTEQVKREPSPSLLGAKGFRPGVTGAARHARNKGLMADCPSPGEPSAISGPEAQLSVVFSGGSLTVPFQQSTKLAQLLRSGKKLPRPSKYFVGYVEARRMLEDIRQHRIRIAYGGMRDCSQDQLAQEFRWCNTCEAFVEPVDLKRYPGYALTAQPGSARLCLRSIATKLTSYSNLRHFVQDVRTVFRNSLAFNQDVPDNFEIRAMAKLLLGVFNTQLRILARTVQTLAEQLRGLIQHEADLDTWLAHDSAPAMYSRCDSNEEGMCITLHVDTHIRPIAACQKLKRGLEVFAEASLPKSIPVLSDARFPGAALAAAAAVRQRNRDLAELKACVAQARSVFRSCREGFGIKNAMASKSWYRRHLTDSLASRSSGFATTDAHPLVLSMEEMKRRTAQHASIVSLLEQVILPQTRASSATKLVSQSMNLIAPDWNLLQHFRCAHCSSSAGEICDGWAADKQPIAATEPSETETAASRSDANRQKSGACICGTLCEANSAKTVLLCRSGKRGPCGGRVHAACNDTLHHLVCGANGCTELREDFESKRVCNFCASLFETSTRPPDSTRVSERPLSLKERRAEDAQMQCDLAVLSVVDDLLDNTVALAAQKHLVCCLQCRSYSQQQLRVLESKGTSVSKGGNTSTKSTLQVSTASNDTTAAPPCAKGLLTASTCVPTPFRELQCLKKGDAAPLFAAGDPAIILLGNDVGWLPCTITQVHVVEASPRSGGSQSVGHRPAEMVAKVTQFSECATSAATCCSSAPATLEKNDLFRDIVYSVVALGGSLTVDNVPADQLRSAETSDAECHRSCDQRGLMPTASSMKKRRRHMIINDIPDDTVVGHPNKTAEAKLAGFRSPEVVQARCGFPNTGYTAHNGFEGAPASPNAVKGHARVLPLAPDLLPAAAALIGKRVTAESFPEASRRSLEQLQHYQKIIERLSSAVVNLSANVAALGIHNASLKDQRDRLASQQVALDKCDAGSGLKPMAKKMRAEPGKLIVKPGADEHSPVATLTQAGRGKGLFYPAPRLRASSSRGAVF